MKIVRKILKYFFLLLIIFIAYPYLISPIYKFPEASVFSGDKIYDPYSGMDSTHWHKANFHAHTRLLYGLTDGRKSLTDSLISTYEKFGYDIIGISDYMYINPKSAVPLYEHGYGLNKTHYLILGDDKVNWFDILFIQNIHNKQFAINMLKTPENILTIAHPSMQMSFEPQDFRYITNYDLIEILRFDRVMTEYLDTALSTGHKTFLQADDDIHDITNSREVAHCYTIINCDTLTPKSILASLKSGKSYGVRTIGDYQNFEEKIADVKNIPKVNNISLTGNKISFRLNTHANDIKFIGQGGEIKKTISDSTYAEYDFKPEDTYIRAEISFDKVKFYMNPFFRYNGSLENKNAEIDFWKTFLYRAFILLAIGFSVFVIYRRKRKIDKRLI